MAEVNHHVLKKGFLVKKRVHKKRWKTCWCILYEDRFVYYRAKDSSAPVGELGLQGASVESHVPSYEHRKAVFKLSLRDGREYLWQCPSKEERDIWAMSLSAGVRSLDSTALRRAESVMTDLSVTTINLSDVLVAMQDADAGLPLKQYHTQHKDFSNCFSGASVLDWLIKWHFASTRNEACVLAKVLLRQAHFLPLPTRDDKNSDLAVLSKEFCDSEEVFYRFTSISLPQSGSRMSSLFVDSSSDSAGSSDAELSEGDVLESDTLVTKGGSVKEGFLMKKGYRLRKKRWKVRKVVLRENPPSISYYSASKNNVQLLKTIALSGAFVVDMEEYAVKSPDDASKRACVFGLSVPLGSTKRTLLTFQAEDVFCKRDWMECLKRVCSSGNCRINAVDEQVRASSVSRS